MLLSSLCLYGHNGQRSFVTCLETRVKLWYFLRVICPVFYSSRSVCKMREMHCNLDEARMSMHEIGRLACFALKLQVLVESDGEQHIS